MEKTKWKGRAAKLAAALGIFLSAVLPVSADWIWCPWWEIPIGAFRGPYGQSYFVYEGCASTYAEAEAYCEAHGGHLAVVNSAEENRYIYLAMRDLGYGAAYIGLSYTDAGKWEWADGSPQIYVNWNGDADAGSADEDDLGQPIPADGCRYAMLTYTPPLYARPDGSLTTEKVSEFEFLPQSSCAWTRTDFNGNIPFICEWE